MMELKNYIAGELSNAVSKATAVGVNPATGETIYQYPSSNHADIELAVSAAQKAFPTWSNLTAEKRADYMHKLSELIARDHEKLAQAECLDTGKPISLTRKIDIPRSQQNFAFFAKAIEQFSSEAYAMPGQQALNYTLRQALGVVACISPWNLPLYLFTWKIAPALAVGNCVVAKPSELTPLTAYYLSELCCEAGLPKGVLNIVHGTGEQVGAPLCQHKDVKAISFTGGTQTGAKVAAMAAPDFKKVSLELGGKNAGIIFADSDFDAMLNTTVRSAFSNQGQICLCTSRLFVEKSIYQKFLDAFAEKVKCLVLGDPKLIETQVGAVISKQHQAKILAAINLAKQDGAELVAGGTTPELPNNLQDGAFVAPTIIAGLDYQHQINQQEIFGPVVSVLPFNDEAEMLKQVNSTQYGLACSLWTQDLTRAHRLAEKIESGIVWINTWMLRDLRTPFGGMKHSGVGREGGFAALRFMTEEKTVCIQY